MHLKQVPLWIYIMSLLPGLLLISCTNKNDKWYPIPEKASAVMVVDPARISQKVVLDKLGDLDFSDLFYSFPDDTTQANDLSSMLDSPSETGIDMLENFYFFKQKDLVGVYAALDDDKDMHYHLQNVLKKHIGKHRQYKFAYLDSSLIAWNQDHCLFLFKKDFSRVHQKELQSLLDIKKEKTIFTNKDFIQSAAEPADVFLWIHLSDLFKEHSSYSQLSEEVLNKQHSSATINFEKGKVEVTIKDLLSSEFAQLLKKPTSASIGNIPFIPTGALHIDIAKGLELIKNDSIENALDGFQPTKKDLAGTFTGQLLFDFAGFTQSEKRYTSYTYDEDFNKIESIETVKVITPSLSLFIRANDSMQTGKILNALSTKRLIDKKPDHYALSLTTMPVIIYNQPNGIHITNEEAAQKKSLLSGLSDHKEFKEHFNSPFFITVDPEKFSLVFNKEDPRNILLNAIESGFIKINNTESILAILSSEIQFKNSDQNSFLTIIDILKRRGNKLY